MARRIPIRNLYYLLCYAWDVLDERDDALVEELDGLSHIELLAKVLLVSAQRLWKRGLDRGYRTLAEERRSPRGRPDLSRTVARRLHERGLLACEFDELSRDVLHNQILATTARRLGNVPGLASTLRDGLLGVAHTLADVSTIELRASTFAQVQLHGHLGVYRLPVHLCALLHSQLLVDEATGAVRFRDFVEDEKRMAALFEEFVRGFYRRELDGWSVGRDVIHWDLEPLTPGARHFVPQMETDVCLRRSGHTVVVETKFYLDAFAGRFQGDKLRSEHLYQLSAYLRNLGRNGGGDASAAGVLLYAEARPLPTLQFQHGPHRVTITGIDLAQEWRSIHHRLLDLVAVASK